jgi:hypothetical protein
MHRRRYILRVSLPTQFFTYPVLITISTSSVLTLSSLANILTFVLGSPALRGVLTIPTNVLAASLISRLMINVRDPRIVRFATPSQTRTRSHGEVEVTASTYLPYVSTVLGAF